MVIATSLIVLLLITLVLMLIGRVLEFLEQRSISASQKRAELYPLKAIRRPSR